MKKVIALLLSLMLTFSLAACSTENNQTTTSPTDTSSTTDGVAPTDSSEEPVTVSVWYYENEGVDEYYEAWADAVHAAYPYITLELEALPYDSGPQKFTVACATNTTPDIYFDGYSRISPAVSSGLCADITDMVTDLSGDFTEGSQKAGVVDGENYFLTIAKSAAYCVAINMDLAAELGVTNLVPEDWSSWSYNDFLALLRAAKQADSSVYPFGLWAGSQSSDAAYYSWFLAAGATLTNSDLTATVFNDATNQPKCLQVLDLFSTIIDEGLCPSGAATLIDQDLNQYWNSGNMLCKMCAFNNASSFYNDMQSETSIQFNYDLVTIPTPEGDHVPTVASWGASGVCIFKNNNHVEAAKKAVSLLITDSQYLLSITKIMGNMSALLNANVQYDTETLTELMARGAAYTSQYSVSDFGILESWWSDFRSTFYPQLQDYYAGNIDAQTLLGNWQSAADAVIASANTGS